jgi:hypothetical protein
MLSYIRGHLVQMFAKVVPKIIDLLKDQVVGIEQKTGSPPRVGHIEREQIFMVSYY